ncbi:GSCOCG00006742001-RA-CDS [Cotesia congregata]|nr:GSCOCG00006742001-RA-CDS [Cotesia congregata]
MAFKEGLNTQTALIKLCDDIRLGIDESKVTIAVFFDFSKAFDSVNHKRLLQKLLSMNFSDNAIEWIRNVLNGVPQGSVLGPLLFNIALLNSEIEKIVKWCDLNCLKLNASKTKAIIFGSRLKVVTVSSDSCINAENILVDNSVIPYVNTVKYLGVILDNNLSWEHQVLKTCNQAMKTLAQLKINNEIFNEQLRVKLVTTLIFPIFDYCCAAFTNMSKKLLLRLQRKMNSCVRFIFKLSRYEHVTPYYNKLWWLKLSKRRDYFIACLFFKEIRLNYRQLFGPGLQYLNVSMRRGDIRQDYLRLPRANSNMYEQSFIIHGIRIWNSLPPGLTTTDSLPEFQNASFSFFLADDN